MRSNLSGIAHVAAVTALLIASSSSGRAFSSDCTQTSVGRIPINELGSQLYLNQFQGGLYPNGSNQMPSAHAAAGMKLVQTIEPLNALGQPDPNGKIVLLSIGMSNTTQEFCSQGSGLPCDRWTFMGQAAAHADVNHATLAMVNGAAGGQAAATWDSPTDLNYDRVRDTRLNPQGLSEAQVQVVWIKVANPQPNSSLPNTNADAYRLLEQTGDIVRAVQVRYPNVQVALLSSRIYAGYASTALNPEPYAYESAFAVKWLIEAQINQMASGGVNVDPIAGDLDYDAGAAPWLAWGPYLWADGLIPRSDGLIWECSDLQSDGTHPAMSGEEKVGSLLLDFMLTSPMTIPWFRDRIPGDIDADGAVNVTDLLAVIQAWGQCPIPPPDCPADVAPPGGDGLVDVSDLLLVVANWN